MASSTYTVVTSVTDHLEADSRIHNTFPEIFSDDELKYKAGCLLFSQVDADRGCDIFKALAKRFRDKGSIAGAVLLRDLLSCGHHAIQDVFNTSGASSIIDEDGLFGRMHEFARKELDVEPIPEKDPTQQTTREDTTRMEAKARDSGISDNDSNWSGALCPFTGLPHAEMAHILPVNAAGATPGRRWFWLWAALILPKPVFDVAWKACGGLNQHSMSNVLILCQPLHRFYDSLNICFRPIVDSPAGIDFELELQIPHDRAIVLSNLRKPDRDGEFLRDGTRLRWQPYTAKTTRSKAPSPLLLSLHRHITIMRAHFDKIGMRDLRRPPRPVLPDADSLLWDGVAGTTRSTPTTPRSAPATPVTLKRRPFGEQALSPSPSDRQRALRYGGDAQMDDYYHNGEDREDCYAHLQDEYDLLDYGQDEDEDLEHDKLEL